MQVTWFSSTSGLSILRAKVIEADELFAEKAFRTTKSRLKVKTCPDDIVAGPTADVGRSPSQFGTFVADTRTPVSVSWTAPKFATGKGILIVSEGSSARALVTRIERANVVNITRQRRASQLILSLAMWKHYKRIPSTTYRSSRTTCSIHHA